MPKLSKSDFVKRFWVPVNQVTKGTGIFPEVLMAQIALETGWAASPHAQPTVNNFVGAKAGSSWTGKVISSTTKENLGNGMETFTGTGKIYANKAAALAAGAHPQTIFRVYPSEAAGLQGYVDVVKGNSNYAAKGVFTATSPTQQVQALKAAGYATDPDYVSKVTSIITGLKSYIQAAGNYVADNSGAFFFTGNSGPCGCPCLN